MDPLPNKLAPAMIEQLADHIWSWHGMYLADRRVSVDAGFTAVHNFRPDLVNVGVCECTAVHSVTSSRHAQSLNGTQIDINSRPCTLTALKMRSSLRCHCTAVHWRLFLLFIPPPPKGEAGIHGRARQSCEAGLIHVGTPRQSEAEAMVLRQPEARSRGVPAEELGQGRRLGLPREREPLVRTQGTPEELRRTGVEVARIRSRDLRLHGRAHHMRHQVAAEAKYIRGTNFLF